MLTEVTLIAELSVYKRTNTIQKDTGILFRFPFSNNSIPWSREISCSFSIKSKKKKERMEELWKSLAEVVIMKHYFELLENPLEGIVVIVAPEDWFTWKVVLKGSKGSLLQRHFPSPQTLISFSIPKWASFILVVHAFISSKCFFQSKSKPLFQRWIF